MYLRLTANFYTAKSDTFKIVKSEKKTLSYNISKNVLFQFPSAENYSKR